jgi:dephospho-CoA kinase
MSGTRFFGLTGGIGTGKSTVARLLRGEHGVPVLDADEVAREVVAPGTPGLSEIVAAFGPEVLTAGGQLDRAAMRARIVRDPDARRALEAITHPRIGEAVTRWMAAQAEAGAPLAGVEAALMVETGTWRRYPTLVVVTCDPEAQVRRVMARDGVAEAAARALIAVQMPMADKVAVANHVVHNDGDLDALRGRVAALHAALLA